jgi:hypothetical protein
MGEGEGNVDCVQNGSELGRFLGPCEYSDKLLGSKEGIPRTSVVPNDNGKH